MKRTFAAFHPIILACALALAAWSAPAQAEEFYRTRWALLIGVGQHAGTGIPPLRFCGNDVDAMQQLLSGRYGFPPDQIVTLRDSEATKQAIVRELSRLADRERVSPEDAVLVYFTGHGQTVPLPCGGEMGFLIPHDAAIDLKDVTNPAPYYETCLGMDELRRLSTLIPARHALFLVDACYSGLAIEGRRGVARDRPLRTVAARPARQVIVAGLKDEEAVESTEWQHGAFTYALLQGLQSGGADLNRDAAVTGLELAAYLRGAVPALAPQTPQYAAFGGDGEFILSPPAGLPPAQPGLRILLTDPPDSAVGSDELPVSPLGGTVALEGLVCGASSDVTLTVEGRPVPLRPATAQDLESADPGARTALAFRAVVEVQQGESKRVELRARGAGGAEAVRRVTVQAAAADARPPDILITEVRALDAEGGEIGSRALAIGSKALVARSKGLTAISKAIAAASRGLTAASKALVATSKTVVVVPRGGRTYRIAGFARDDRSVVAITLGGRPVPARPASRAELDALDWSAGVAFEGTVTIAAGEPADVAVTASDGAGNTETVEVTLLPGPANEPEVLLLEPGIEERVRGTGLVLPRSQERMRIAGVARSARPLRRITVAGREAEVRTATPDELRKAGWQPPATFFSLQVAVPASGGTEYLLIHVVDESGNESTRLVPARRTGGTVDLRVQSVKRSYRIGEKVRFSLEADRECYIYLLHREADGGLALFLPNPVEPDTRLRPEGERLFPDPEEEARWRGQYALVAQEPVGTDTVYCLAVPSPIPAALLETLTTFQAVAKAVETTGRHRGAKLVLPPAPREEDIGKLAQELGGTWTLLRYQVTR